MPTIGLCSSMAVSYALTMWAQPSTPIAPPITVPSVQNATVRTPLTVPAAASTPERSRSCRNSRVQPSSKNVFRRCSGSRGSNDSPTASGAVMVIETSYKGRNTGALVLPEGERHVVPTESERVVDRVLIVAGSRRTGDDVEVDLRILVLQVQRRRNDTVAQRQHGEDRLDGAHRTDRVAERGFRCVYRRFVAAHRVVDRLSFRHVTDAGAGGVCVHVVDVRRLETRELDRPGHRVPGLFTIGVGR